MVDIIAWRRRFVSQDKQASALSIISSRPYQFFFPFHYNTYVEWKQYKETAQSRNEKAKKNHKKYKEITPVFVLVFLLVAYE